MMYVKFMSGEDIPDEDPRKCYHMVSDANHVHFLRINGELMATIIIGEGDMVSVPVMGDVYILNELGDIIDYISAELYDSDGPDGGIEANEDDSSNNTVAFNVKVPNADSLRRPAAKRKDDMKMVLETLDMMGVLLAYKDHKWTADQRSAYTRAIRILNGELGIPVQPIEASG